MANQGEGDKPLTARENACDQIASALVWSDWFRSGASFIAWISMKFALSEFLDTENRSKCKKLFFTLL